MFKRRRRSAAAPGGSDQPFCAMCGQSTRIDIASGRCALGHRVAVAPVTAAVAPVVEVTPLVAAAGASDFGSDSDRYGDPYADTIVWEPSNSVVHSEPASDIDALDEFIAWEQPGGGTFSALDVDTNDLPTADSVEAAAANELAPPVHDLGSNLLDELDDAAHARRTAAGTIGATVVVSGMVFVAIAALPF